jgi:hypothetical protein
MVTLLEAANHVPSYIPAVAYDRRRFEAITRDSSGLLPLGGLRWSAGSLGRQYRSRDRSTRVLSELPCTPATVSTANRWAVALRHYVIPFPFAACRPPGLDVRRRAMRPQVLDQTTLLVAADLHPVATGSAGLPLGAGSTSVGCRPSVFWPFSLFSLHRAEQRRLNVEQRQLAGKRFTNNRLVGRCFCGLSGHRSPTVSPQPVPFRLNRRAMCCERSQNWAAHRGQVSLPATPHSSPAWFVARFNMRGAADFRFTQFRDSGQVIVPDEPESPGRLDDDPDRLCYVHACWPWVADCV